MSREPPERIGQLAEQFRVLSFYTAYAYSEILLNDNRALAMNKPGLLVIRGSDASVRQRFVFVDFGAVVEPTRWDGVPKAFLVGRSNRLIRCQRELERGNTDPALALAGYLKRDITRFERMPEKPSYARLLQSLAARELAFARQIEQAILTRELGAMA